MTMMTPQKVGCLIAQRSKEKLFQYASIGDESGYYEFEKEVLWGLESETSIVFFHNIELKKEVVLNDFYGYLTSLQDNSNLLERLLEKYQISHESSLELRLLTKIVATPYYENEECKIWNADAKESNLKYKLCSVPATHTLQFKDISGQSLYRPLSPITLEEQTVWRSSLSKEDNDKVKADFISKWSSPKDLPNLINLSKPSI